MLCEQFNTFVNTMKKEEMQELYPWFDPSNERKNMSDSEIPEKICRLQQIMSDRHRKETSHGYAL